MNASKDFTLKLNELLLPQNLKDSFAGLLHFVQTERARGRELSAPVYVLSKKGMDLPWILAANLHPDLRNIPKEALCAAIADVCAREDIDYLMTVTESWFVEMDPEDKPAFAKWMAEVPGRRIRDHEKAREVLMVLIETRDHTWMSRVVCDAAVGTRPFLFADCGASAFGNFMNLLPGKRAA